MCVLAVLDLGHSCINVGSSDLLCRFYKVDDPNLLCFLRTPSASCFLDHSPCSSVTTFDGWNKVSTTLFSI